MDRDDGNEFSPGEVLHSCNGQDLLRKKKAKGRNRVMVVLPAQLAFQHGTEGQIGTLEKADTENPEFVIETAEVRQVEKKTGHRTMHDNALPTLTTTTPRVFSPSFWCRARFVFPASTLRCPTHS